MSTVQFHRRYRHNQPINHFCEQWNVHLFNGQGEPETYRVNFRLNKQEIPCFDVSFQGPSGAFNRLSRQTHYARIKRVMQHLQAEFDDYKRNRNYQKKIS